MKTILITGAAGQVGRVLRDGLAGRFCLRLFDRTPVEALGSNEVFIQGDLGDPTLLRGAMEDVDGIVHLAAVPAEDSWEEILPNNIVGAYNLFEAARAASVKRVVFASSNHAVGFYRRDQHIGPNVTVRPDSRYGVSKAFGEAIASLYADKYGLETFCIRIGNVADRPIDARRLAIWVSPRDLCQLVAIGLEHPDIHFEIVYGVSDNARSWWDNSRAAQLGYRPEDDAEDHAAAVVAKEPPHDPDDRQHLYQGGHFVKLE
ncbi:MAG: NAD(P)-dependent oxidoreductase [Kiloniellales bacterium]|nr:NAD(P)-dependent oxidoreductase [Kiloniellales bacterium]